MIVTQTVDEAVAEDERVGSVSTQTVDEAEAEVEQHRQVRVLEDARRAHGAGAERAAQSGRSAGLAGGGAGSGSGAARRAARAQGGRAAAADVRSCTARRRARARRCTRINRGSRCWHSGRASRRRRRQRARPRVRAGAGTGGAGAATRSVICDIHRLAYSGRQYEVRDFVIVVRVYNYSFGLCL